MPFWRNWAERSTGFCLEQRRKSVTAIQRAVFRIGNPNYIYDLTGQGARMYAGRWHPKGTPVLYTAETASLCILEYLGHITPIQARVPYILLEIILDDSQSTQVEEVSADLPADWFTDESLELTRQIGKDWAIKQHSAVLQVPSVHSPYEHNFLINPAHPALSIQVSKQKWYLYDRRFLRTTPLATK